MALTDFKTAFDEAYQEIFQKVLVAMEVANTRLEDMLFFGQAVERVKYDIDSVDVQDITLHSDMTVDSISDTKETLTVNNNKGTLFPLSAKEMVQAGPLNPAEVIGGKVAHKLATYVDADVLYETTNANLDFDTGDLTTLASTGVPITINSTTTPQMVSRMPAKLQKNNQTLMDLALVIDSYGASDMFQYMLGKDADFTKALWENGNTGETVASATIYISENLTGEAVLGLATQPTANDTVVIEGVTFTFVASPSSAGDVDLGANVDATRANLAAAINAGSGAGTDYIELSAADRRTITKVNRITATNDDTANTLTIVGKGSGRLTVSETLTDGTDAWDKNFIHAYFGRKGGIDVVVQSKPETEMRPEPKQPTDNVLSTVLYGIKTFDDGKRKFLDVLISS